MFLGVLAQLSLLPVDRELSPKEREALDAALRYFREAAPKHTADEEESLFPRLRRSDALEAHDVLRRVDALEADHRAASIDHGIVEERGSEWLLQGRLSPEGRDSFRGAVGRLQDRYRRHIEIEDREVFPAAARLLSRGDLMAVGGEMARRRGLSDRSILHT